MVMPYDKLRLLGTIDEDSVSFVLIEHAAAMTVEEQVPILVKIKLSLLYITKSRAAGGFHG
jgi:hypothetical protein